MLFESESCSVVSDSLGHHGLYSPWDSSGHNTGVGSFSLLQGIFPTQGSNPGLPHCRQILYQLSQTQGVIKKLGSWDYSLREIKMYSAGTRRASSWYFLFILRKEIILFIFLIAILMSMIFHLAVICLLSLF